MTLSSSMLDAYFIDGRRDMHHSITSAKLAKGGETSKHFNN